MEENIFTQFMNWIGNRNGANVAVGSMSPATGGYNFMKSITDAGKITNMPATIAPTTAGIGNTSFMDGMLGYTDTDGTKVNGWGGMALGAGSALLNAWQGMREMDLARDQLNFQKEAWNKNWEAQKSTTNADLEARQRNRVAALGGEANAQAAGYRSVSDYMDKYGIK